MCWALLQLTTLQKMTLILSLYDSDYHISTSINFLVTIHLKLKYFTVDRTKN